jgi:hypothetical protein
MNSSIVNMAFPVPYLVLLCASTKERQSGVALAVCTCCHHIDYLLSICVGEVAVI